MRTAWLGFMTFCAMLSCGSEGDDFWLRQQARGEPLDTRSALQALASDVDDMASYSGLGVRANAATRLRLEQAFGGRDGRHLRAYFDARIRHYLTLKDAARYVVEGSGLVETTRPDPLSDIEVGAINWGADLWMTRIVQDAPMTLRGDKVFSIDSSRVGLMLIGPGYNPTRFSGSGDEATLDVYGPLFRQGILLHEARHSDCTGGFLQWDVELARRGITAHTFATKRRGPSCNHTHVPCPDGPYADIFACDGHAWGAYALQLLFIDALLGTPTLARADVYFLEGIRIDIRSRLLLNYEDMLAGAFGPPDMSHYNGIVPSP